MAAFAAAMAIAAVMCVTLPGLRNADRSAPPPGSVTDPA
jgi:hypothetical protein